MWPKNIDQLISRLEEPKLPFPLFLDWLDNYLILILTQNKIVDFSYFFHFIPIDCAKKVWEKSVKPETLYSL